MYILTAIDYLSKWAHAITLNKARKENVVGFIRTHIIFEYGVPRYVIIDDGKPFVNKLISRLCEKFNFSQHKPSMYNAPANDPTKTFNKTLCNLLKKVVSKSKARLA